MAVSFLELERFAGGVVEPGGPVIFDNVISSSGTGIGYNPGTGEIIFNSIDFYFVNWFVSSSFSLTTDGSNFAIITSAGDPPFIGSSHIRVSPTIGFAVFSVDTPGTTATLVNTSDGAITLSPAVAAKAALVVFTVAGPESMAPAA